MTDPRNKAMMDLDFVGKRLRDDLDQSGGNWDKELDLILSALTRVRDEALAEGRGDSDSARTVQIAGARIHGEDKGWKAGMLQAAEILDNSIAGSWNETAIGPSAVAAIEALSIQIRAAVAEKEKE